ncbi:MAG: hypothetical protein IJZ82_08460 [Lachnospiraceae bacterium]|nr:hypothetical protein [Lachnospiraceae bacterium]
MQLVVNDLSTKFPCKSEHEAQEIMEKFIETYYLVKSVLHDNSIFLDKHYNTFELAPGYRFEQWLNDRRIDIELKRKFRRVLNQSITFDSEAFEKDYQWRTDAEFVYGELVSKSCQLAYEIEGVLISFLMAEHWRNPVVNGIYTYLTADEELVSEKVDIPNVSCAENAKFFITQQEEILALQRKEGIHSGMDIFLCKDEVFPNLVFCDNVIKQLKTEIGSAEAGQVYRRLKEIQMVAKDMQGGFDFGKLTHATPESLATLKRYANEHTFLLPNGNVQLFSWHVRFTGAYAGRIFFEPVPKEAKVYIGHIGEKLPTVLYH